MPRTREHGACPRTQPLGRDPRFCALKFILSCINLREIRHGEEGIGSGPERELARDEQRTATAAAGDAPPGRPEEEDRSLQSLPWSGCPAMKEENVVQLQRGGPRSGAKGIGLAMREEGLLQRRGMFRSDDLKKSTTRYQHS